MFEQLLSVAATPKGAPRRAPGDRTGLGRGVRAGRVVGRALGESVRIVERQVAVDLVGGDVVVPNAVPARCLQQRVRADQVRRDEHRRVTQRVVIVGFGRKVHDEVLAAYQFVNQAGVADVALDEGKAILGKSFED